MHLHHVMNQNCFEKYLTLKKSDISSKTKNWLPSEGRSDSLSYTLKKTDIKFGRGDCEWRVCSILSTQYSYIGLKSQY